MAGMEEEDEDAARKQTTSSRSHLQDGRTGVHQVDVDYYDNADDVNNDGHRANHNYNEEGSEQDQRDAEEDDLDMHSSGTWLGRLSRWCNHYNILIKSTAKAIALFGFCLVGLILLLKLSLPPIDPEDQPNVKIPRNFEDLKQLNAVLQVYKERNFARVLGSYIALYLFLQAYSLPGSMYLSILAGAMYGVFFALPLVCLCVATGATLCYLISALLGPALLLASKTWRDRLESWRIRIRKQGGNMISYLIVLRIAPLPPHWFINVLAPHLHISIPLFWISTFLGVMGVSFIHVQIGTTLDQMTSPSEFHLISWRNFFGLSGVVIAVMLPVIMRYLWTRELAEAAQDSVEVVQEALSTDDNMNSSSNLPENGTTLNVGEAHEVLAIAEGKTNERDIGFNRSRREGWETFRAASLIRLPPDEEDAVEVAVPTSPILEMGKRSRSLDRGRRPSQGQKNAAVHPRPRPSILSRIFLKREGSIRL